MDAYTLKGGHHFGQEIHKPEGFLLYTDEILKMFGIHKKVSSKDAGKYGHSDDEEYNNKGVLSDNVSDYDDSDDG